MAVGRWGAATAFAACGPKASKTIFAASGSTQTFHSVVGAVLPDERYEPPMITTRLRSRGSEGSRSSARATLVNGASVTRVNSPGRRRASSTIRSGA
jgi:hypothetical protein